MFWRSSPQSGWWQLLSFLLQNDFWFLQGGPLPVISRVVSYKSTCRGYNSSYPFIRPFKKITGRGPTFWSVSTLLSNPPTSHRVYCDKRSVVFVKLHDYAQKLRNYAPNFVKPLHEEDQVDTKKNKQHLKHDSGRLRPLKHSTLILSLYDLTKFPTWTSFCEQSQR